MRNRLNTAQQHRTPVQRLLASRFTMRCFYILTVLLVLFDWSFDLGLIGFGISKYLRAFLLVVFSVYLFQTGPQLSRFQFPFGNVFVYFIAVNIIYSFISSDIIGNLLNLTRILFWMLGSVVAYRLTLSGIFSIELLRKMIIGTVFLGATFTIYLMTRPSIEAGQNASAYLLLWCLPFLLLMKRSRMNNIILTLAIFAILLTVKRGAMIAFILSIVTYSLTYLKLNISLKRLKKMFRLFLTMAIVSTYVLITNWDAIQTRFQDTSGSGRDQMYTMLINHWINGKPENIIFGFGIKSVEKYSGYMFSGGRRDTRGAGAHSDWLQYTHDFGLLGIGFILWLHIKVLALIRRSYIKRHPFTPSLVMGYTILFLVNIYSIHLPGPNAIYFVLLYSFTAANILLQYPPGKKL